MPSKPPCRPRAFRRSDGRGTRLASPFARHSRLRRRSPPRSRQKHGWFHDVQYTRRECGSCWLEFSLRRLEGSLYIPGSLSRCRLFSPCCGDRRKGYGEYPDSSPIYHQHTNNLVFSLSKSDFFSHFIHQRHESAMTISPPFVPALSSTTAPDSPLRRLFFIRSASRASLRLLSCVFLCMLLTPQGRALHTALGKMFLIPIP
jgi:hypothetical protein